MAIDFAPVWGDRGLACDGPEPQLTDLRFFVSELAVLDSNGAEHALRIVNDERWQQADVALLDLENGKDACMNGTAQSHARLEATAGIEDVSGLRFTLGVPFLLNHQDPLSAKAPLDRPAMHWHWRSGYKFLRAGVRTDNDHFWLHLGSTACEGTVQNISGCRSPNRVSVDLPAFRKDRNRIEVDLAALFAGIDLHDGIPGDCSSAPSEEDCVAPFQALGLPFGRHDTAPGEQSVFRVAQ